MLFSALLISSLIITSEPGQPTEVIGSAATPDGGRKSVTVEQPEGTDNPFGYIVPQPSSQTNTQNTPLPDPPPTNQTQSVEQLGADTNNNLQPLVSQTSTTNPQQMNQNPLYYQDKIENTIYQDGDRLLDVQSIPIKDINQALTPNIQPTISNYPAF